MTSPQESNPFLKSVRGSDLPNAPGQPTSPEFPASGDSARRAAWERARRANSMRSTTGVAANGITEGLAALQRRSLDQIARRATGVIGTIQPARAFSGLRLIAGPVSRLFLNLTPVLGPDGKPLPGQPGTEVPDKRREREWEDSDYVRSSVRDFLVAELLLQQKSYQGDPPPHGEFEGQIPDGTQVRFKWEEVAPGVKRLWQVGGTTHGVKNGSKVILDEGGFVRFGRKVVFVAETGDCTDLIWHQYVTATWVFLDEHGGVLRDAQGDPERPFVQGWRPDNIGGWRPNDKRTYGVQGGYPDELKPSAQFLDDTPGHKTPGLLVGTGRVSIDYIVQVGLAVQKELNARRKADPNDPEIKELERAIDLLKKARGLEKTINFETYLICLKPEWRVVGFFTWDLKIREIPGADPVVSHGDTVWHPGPRK